MKIEPLKTKISENMQEYLDKTEKLKKGVLAELMLPESFFNHTSKR